MTIPQTFFPGFEFHRHRSKNFALNTTSTSHINNSTSLFWLFLSQTRSAPTLKPLAVNKQKIVRNQSKIQRQSFLPLENVSFRASNFKFDAFPPLFRVFSTRLIIDRASTSPSSPKYTTVKYTWRSFFSAIFTNLSMNPWNVDVLPESGKIMWTDSLSLGRRKTWVCTVWMGANGRITTTLVRPCWMADEEECSWCMLLLANSRVRKYISYWVPVVGSVR